MQHMETMEKGQLQADQPRDTYKIAYILHFFLGAGNLLPWNTLITAIDYFGYLYPNRNVEKVLAVAYMSASVLVLIMMLTCDKLMSQKVNLRLRMNLGFSMFVFSLMVTPSMDWTNKHNNSNVSYCLMIASVVICGLADGLIGGTLVGSAGKLPKQYMQAIFAGTASSGVLVSMLRILTKASLPQTPVGLRASAHLYFIVSTILLILCLVCSNLLYRMPVMQQYYKLHDQKDLSLCSNSRFWEVARKIKWAAFGVAVIYTVTLSIFPGFLAEDIKSGFFKDWFPIMLISMYNISDLIGKSLTAWFVMEGISKVTWCCVARILFYPLFRGCLHGPKWLRTDAPVAVLTVFLGLTNGYLTSCIMILAPKSVPSSESETAAIVMVVFLGIGLVAGSVLGWFWAI
ncbi:OLC1v1037980C1 [Oldenlandia corymbosa var. corymbosa]|uniref:OLC1v1037980C1 n=1 Tax=Oldenlandia corymbosa var. corymbosa TaxID=529605 RepID=A0AAV1CYQ1_OLDCO|nr:OLC1v1037980C1 [Oldenlandia corymbosa var. corymbosa]